ncbi:MAG: hypothetical protein AAF614_37410 [Chloroflexota bacterium]
MSLPQGARHAAGGEALGSVPFAVAGATRSARPQIGSASLGSGARLPPLMGWLRYENQN